jgi:hypothetical protein
LWYCLRMNPFALILPVKRNTYLVVFVMGISSEVWNFFFDFKFCKTVWVPAVYNMMIVVVVAELKKTLIINLHQHNLV